jgi:transcriptional regulator with PAS, ATPase and Fis domain
MADGGTLFLDEIGDISLKTQVDLLRVLEDRKICRVGGNTLIPVDFRLIAATNRDLEAMVADGRFREDLYYRLNVFSITVPPLRERREDIPLLAEHFLRKFAHSMNKAVTGIQQDALNRLVAFDWPGNVRELQNAMERAVLVCAGKEIQPGDLPFHTARPEEPSANKTLASMEKDHIKRVLEETHGNISQAARLLEIDRVTLYNKMKKYDLKPESGSDHKDTETRRNP